MKIIDLSTTIQHQDRSEIEPTKVEYINHKKGGNLLGLAGCLLADKKFLKKLKNFFLYISGLKKIKNKDFPEALGLAWERVSVSTHCGTHLDAPYHYGPGTAARPALRIDQLALEYFFSDGVRLDFRHKKTGEIISVGDLKQELQKINYLLKPKDIVLIMTGADKYIHQEDYPFCFPSLDTKSVEWLIDKGIKVIGTDTWGIDRPVNLMIKDFFLKKNNAVLWPIHILGRKREYFQIEKLVGLDEINKPFGFKVACFPIKIKNASAGWVRAVAIIEE